MLYRLRLSVSSNVCSRVYIPVAPRSYIVGRANERRVELGGRDGSVDGGYTDEKGLEKR